MKRPEKKEEKPFKVFQVLEENSVIIEINLEKVYNQALDDIDNYLPNEEEILSLLPPQQSTPFDMGAYARAISKRIRQ